MDHRAAHTGSLTATALVVTIVLAASIAGAQQNQPSAQEQDFAAIPTRLQIEIVQSTREGRVYLDGQRIGSFPVAVGQPEWPTPTGEFHIDQVDWNPDWTPTDSEWAQDASYTPPGHPDNPMGRVRMIYQAPYSLHGTDDYESLGSAASHGSIRVANETIVQLARLVMEYGGEPRDEEWYQRVLENRTEMVEVELPNPVPIRIVE